MNAKQKLHQVHLQEWTVRFADQKASGLTVQQWCEQNNLSFHTYNYWKHFLKEEVVEQVLPDIVPLGVYIVCGYTDLRFGIDSLAAIIERRFHMHLFVPNTLFLFCGRSSTRIKGLLWEGDGFLLYKRVESGHFTWPRSSTELRFLSAEQFHWLMQGFSIDPVIHDITPDASV